MSVHLIDGAPELLYPDLGCPSWPACLECPFSLCIYTGDKLNPTRDQHRLALQRARIVACTFQGMTQRATAAEVGVTVTVVERGIKQYWVDMETARRKNYAEPRIHA